MKIAVFGFGNLGKGVVRAIFSAHDAELTGVFTRRDPVQVSLGAGLFTDIPFYPADSLLKFAGDTDVLIVCGGSVADLPILSPRLAENFNIVDSFDTHGTAEDHVRRVDASARSGENLALVCSGWDPGLFSLMRLFSESVLPDGKSYTFWGRGISQGHSEAIRRISGVRDARQYTVPDEDALDAARYGVMPELPPRKLHRRECYVVAEDGADREEIEQKIRTMPEYFAGYETTVHFVSERELKTDHGRLTHGGCVIRAGLTGRAAGDVRRQRMEFSLELGSNPDFTGSILVACARAVYRMRKDGRTGCVTVFDIPPAYFSPLSPSEARLKYL